jgi:hypothetical protein
MNPAATAWGDHRSEYRLLERGSAQPEPRHEGRVNLDLLAVVEPHRSDEGPGFDVSLTNQRRFGWSTGNADLTHREAREIR